MTIFILPAHLDKLVVATVEGYKLDNNVYMYIYVSLRGIIQVRCYVMQSFAKLVYVMLGVNKLSISVLFAINNIHEL